MTRKLLLGLLALCPLFVAAQGLTGAWTGTLNAGGQSLKMIFRITEQAGVPQVTLDVPAQGIRQLPVQVATLSAAQLDVEIPQFGASYKGMLLPMGTLSGVFSQHGAQMPLVLTRMELRRPQTPQAPYPYRSIDLEIPAPKAGITLHGTLTLPEGEGLFPAVVLVSGSGTQNRDEEIMGHKPFWVIADYLTRHGIAVLRYDDRGYGMAAEELEPLKGTTTADLADDALAVFEVLRTQPGIDPARVGIAGHSEGGAIAFIAAARNLDVAFVVSLAGMAEKGRVLHVRQVCDAMAAQGAPRTMVDDFRRLLEQTYDIVEQTPSDRIATEGAERLDTLLAAEGGTLPAPLRQSLQGMLMLGADPWFRFFLLFDPAEDIRSVGGRPLMAINGDRDTQVDAAANLGSIAALRPAAQYPEDCIRTYEGLNHLFQPCTTGSVDEYEQIETTFAEPVLQDIVAWIGGLR